MEVTAQNIFSSKRLCLEVSGLVGTSSLSELLLVPKALAEVCLQCAVVALAAAQAPVCLVMHHLLSFLKGSHEMWEVWLLLLPSQCSVAGLQPLLFLSARVSRHLCVPGAGEAEGNVLDAFTIISSSRTNCWCSEGSTSRTLLHLMLSLISCLPSREMKLQITEWSQSVCFLSKRGQTQAVQWIAS